MQLSETLRLARLEDIPVLVGLMDEFFKASPYANMTFDYAGTVSALNRNIPDYKNFMFVVSVLDDVPVGFLAAYKTKLPYTVEPIAAELAWYLSPSYRTKHRGIEMVGAYIAWAKAVGCKRAQAAKLVNSGPVDVLYRRWGFTETETAYMKEL